MKFLSSKQSIEYFNSTNLIVPARMDVKVDDSAFEVSIEQSEPVHYGKDYKKISDSLNKKFFK